MVSEVVGTMGAAMTKGVAVFAAVHVAAVLMTFGAGMGPSGAVVKGVVPKMMVVPPEMTMVTEAPAAPAEVVVVA